MPREKIVLGLSAYGRSWTLNSPLSYNMGSPAYSPGNPGKVRKISWNLGKVQLSSSNNVNFS